MVGGGGRDPARLGRDGTMPKLKPEVQRARREHILDAAEHCFGRAGFHRTTMHDICREAGVSPGALYVYFDSKEALIAGICERDRAGVRRAVRSARRGARLHAGAAGAGRAVFPRGARRTGHRMCIEIGLESTRNPRVGEIHQRIDRYIVDSFEKLFRKMQARAASRRRSTSRPLPRRSWSCATACSGAAPSTPSFDPGCRHAGGAAADPHAPQSRAAGAGHTDNNNQTTQ